MIDEFNESCTGWARFSNDQKLRFRLARSTTGEALRVHNGQVFINAAFPLASSKAVFIMLNPSVASAHVNDPTIKRGMGFSAAWGCDIYEAANIHPLRSTDPKGLYSWTGGDVWNAANIAEIMLACRDATHVIAAWGLHGAYKGRGRQVAAALRRNDIKLHHLGLTKAGYPKHPLYLRADTEPTEWRI